MARGPVVRKILLASKATNRVFHVAVASSILAIVGFALYRYSYPSSIVLFEAFVWLIEAVSFMGIALSMKVASSKMLAYRARYEFLRIEALASIVIGFVSLVIVFLIVFKTIVGVGEPTPPALALYPIGSGLASYILEAYLKQRLRRIRLKLASVHVVMSKLRYDVLVEIGGGVAILAANVFENVLLEKIPLLAIGAYVAHGLVGVIYNNTLYLIGPGPYGHMDEIRRKIVRETRRHGYSVRRVRVELYGTFAEAEVWIELSGEQALREAHKKALYLARRLVHEVPELLRVLVVTVPTAPGPRRKPVRAYKSQEKLRREEERR